MQNLVPRPWRISAALTALSLVPFAATANRLIWLSDAGAVPDPAMERFAGSWTMLIVHILCGSVFLILATFQFSPEIRARSRGWHRIAGRIAVLAGLTAGLSGVWLALAGPLVPESATALITLGFAVNLVFAEWRIRAPLHIPHIPIPHRRST